MVVFVAMHHFVGDVQFNLAHGAVKEASSQSVSGVATHQT